jgi:pilus assembly protein Flp/PilA
VHTINFAKTAHEQFRPGASHCWVQAESSQAPPCGITGVSDDESRSLLFKDEAAATAIEYGLIAAGISVVIIVAVNGVGVKLTSIFSSISTQLK